MDFGFSEEQEMLRQSVRAFLEAECPMTYVRQMMEDVGPQNFVRQQTAIISRVDSRPTLATIRCPTLVLVGDADTLTPPDRATEMADGISGALSVLNSGHLSPLEQPEYVAQALVEWMRG